MSDKYILQMTNIEKEYYGNKVLKGVSLKLKPGEILALVGEKWSRKIHFNECLVWNGTNS